MWEHANKVGHINKFLGGTSFVPHTGLVAKTINRSSMLEDAETGAIRERGRGKRVRCVGR